MNRAMIIQKKSLWAIIVMVLFGSAAIAQQNSWRAVDGQNPRECWAVSVPQSQENTRNGQRVDVQRGETALMVFDRPGENVSGHVAYTGGYPFASGSAVTVAIDGRNFQFSPDGEWAWPAPGADAQIVEALKRGNRAIITARSSRGTVTRDTFSLIGFTSALNEAQGRCR